VILLYTDFGPGGPWVGQLTAVLARSAPSVPIVELMSDAPSRNPRAAAYLLAALLPGAPPAAVLLGVVDPGVGSADRRPVVVRADGRWMVGPDNGLFEVAAARSRTVRWYDITWRPERVSHTFHGRDLFAPVAAALARGEAPPGRPVSAPVGGWPDELAEVIYVDAFGNVMTGVRAASLAAGAAPAVGDGPLRHGRTYSDVLPGEAFWYENSLGLVEIAVNGGTAAGRFALSIGDPVPFTRTACA